MTNMMSDHFRVFIIIMVMLTNTVIISNQSSVDDMAAVARGDGQTRSSPSPSPLAINIGIIISIISSFQKLSSASSTIETIWTVAVSD